MGAMIVKDTYTGSDSTDATSRAPDFGPTPVSTSSTYLIQSNQLTNANANPGGATYHALAYECGTPNVDITAQMTNEDGGGEGTYDLWYLVARWVDGDNFFQLGLGETLHLYRLVSGAATLIGDEAVSFTDGNTYTVRLVVRGDQFLCYLDGDLIYSVADSTFIDATEHGVQIDANVTAISTLDNLVIRGSLSPAMMLML